YYNHIASCLCYCLLYQCSDHHHDLYSFPTRRSSDLIHWLEFDAKQETIRKVTSFTGIENPSFLTVNRKKDHLYAISEVDNGEVRSEEHTSELQSRFDLVCRLLLEKKKRSTAKRITQQ